MMTFNTSIIPTIIDCELLQKNNESKSIQYLAIDSRKIIHPEKSIFFAIKGVRNDGHRYLIENYELGIREFIVEKKELNFVKSILSKLPFATVIVVDSTIEALQKIVAFKRRSFSIPIVGITGSNAKTIVKEWLSQLLSPEFAVVKNPRSYNSQVGVPLSVWQITEAHQIGVFEAGISKPAEMEKLNQIILPTIGIFTNIGTAHAEGFTSQNQKIAEKLKLFIGTEYVIYRKDHKEIDNAVQQHDLLKGISWSTAEPADYQFEIKSTTKNETEVLLVNQQFIFSIPYSDAASVENILHCVVLLLQLKFTTSDIARKTGLLKPVSMRLELKEGINNCYLIDDSYNNDLAGLKIGLDFLNQQKQKTKKALILSDIYESGLTKKDLYRSVSDLIYEKGIEKLIAIGDELAANRHLFKNNATFYKTTKEFLSSNQVKLFSEELILVKGARLFKFEEVVKALEKRSHRTIFEINLDALAHNFNYYKSLLKPTTKVMAMVKSFAYGAGSLEVAHLLQFLHVDYLAVAYTDEGVKLREAGINTPIMVMNPSIDDFDLMCAHYLQPAIYSISFFDQLNLYLDENDQHLAIHIEIETGMNRLGLQESELPYLIAQIKKTNRLRVVSVFSHLAGADEEQFAEYTQTQFGRLLGACSKIENGLRYKFLKHILNSAGIVRYLDFQLDMVRLGIGLYGVEANAMKQNELQTVSTLKTIISQIKFVKKGETIGYSRKGKAEKDLKIGIIGIGYGDGYNRGFSNGVGKVMINGKIAPVIGNVCMDMTMVDLSNIEAREGDEVEVFGSNLKIMEVAKSIGTIPYEILTSVSERVKRVFYSE